MRRLEQAAWIALAALGIALPMACGSRTGLPDRASADASTGQDAGFDHSVPPVDASEDQDAADADDGDGNVVFKDVKFDGLAPCDPNALFVYLVTEESTLYRYDPSKGTLFNVGKLDCPTNGSPFSMGVSRSGIAYILHRPLSPTGSNPPGQLYAASVETAACVATEFVPGQQGFGLFGMGFALDDDGMGETLYVAAGSQPANQVNGLGSIDLTTYGLDFVGPFMAAPGDRMELTSSDDGSLYGYFVDSNSTGGGSVVSIDKHTGAILDVVPVSVQGDASAFAFAYWGGDFYIFTAPLNGKTTITRYRPTDGTLKVVGSVPQAVVGAGVSTCTPSKS